MCSSFTSTFFSLNLFQLPPTVDLPDYFGQGEDEGEFLLKDEPITLTLTTVHGKVVVGALSVHLYYGIKKRPFIAPKEAQTDPHLVSKNSFMSTNIIGMVSNKRR